nr:MAG TPA: hypothetical protein [Caudoviricetes sp.]
MIILVLSIFTTVHSSSSRSFIISNTRFPITAITHNGIITISIRSIRTIIYYRSFITDYSPLTIR